MRERDKKETLLSQARLTPDYLLQKTAWPPASETEASFQAILHGDSDHVNQKPVSPPKYSPSAPKHSTIEQHALQISAPGLGLEACDFNPIQNQHIRTFILKFFHVPNGWQNYELHHLQNQVRLWELQPKQSKMHSQTRDLSAGCSAGCHWLNIKKVHAVPSGQHEILKPRCLQFPLLSCGGICTSVRELNQVKVHKNIALQEIARPTL